MLKGQMTSVLRLAKLDFRYERSLSSMVTCSNFIIAFFLWTQHLLCNYYTIFRWKSKQLFDARTYAVFALAKGKWTVIYYKICVRIASMAGDKWFGKNPLLLPVSCLIRRLHVAAAYSILHLAGLTLVWYNAGFGLFLGWCLMVF